MCVCRASTGFGWTVTAYTAVLSSAGMAQGFAGPARLIPDALRVARHTSIAVTAGTAGTLVSKWRAVCCDLQQLIVYRLLVRLSL